MLGQFRRRNRNRNRISVGLNGLSDALVGSEAEDRRRRSMQYFVAPVFLPCDALRCTVFVIVILSVRLSVRLSVCLSHSWTVSTWFDLRS